jgi:ABC-type multidrug transport system permease subunit
MIMRGMGLGFLLWLANAALFRFAGQYFFLPSSATPYLLFAVAAVLGVAITFVLLKALREARGDEGEAAIAVAFPSLLLNAFLTYEFATAFPNLDAGLDGVYGGLAMLYAAAMVFTGLMMTKLAPQDERV